MTTVSICMLTYKRQDLLRKALASLSRMSLQMNTEAELCVVIVDNDSARSAEKTVASLNENFPFPLHYVVEPEQGIARARNRALAEGAKTEFMAFLDDDEVVEEDWIDQLLTAQRTFQADVVSGPVIPDFEDAPPWVLKGGFFAMREEENGAPIHFVETNNVLLRSELAKKYEFDLRFNKTSGEDTHFFLRLERDGARMVWASKARVHEFIPKHRTSAPWLIERAQSDANRYTRARLYLTPGMPTRAIRVVKAVSALSAGCALFVSTAFLSEHRRVKAVRLMSRALGTTRALLGSAHLYYVPGKPLR